MADDEAQKKVGVGSTFIIYICLLVLAATQFVIGYMNIDETQKLVRMLVVACIEGGLALLFFMHLWENRGLKWFVLIFTIAVLLGMQYGWTDSFRLIDGVPWAK